MDKDKFKKIVDNSNFIPSIYNYCDAWCRRCPFTTRCAVFAMEKAVDAPPESRDIENEAFWKHLHEIFATTKELVMDWAEENEVDLDELPSEEEEAYEEHLNNETEEHELSQSAMKYMEMVRTWFGASNELFEEKAQDLGLKAELDLPAADPEAEVADLNDLTEVIQWYHMFICAKIRRAVHGELRGVPECIEGLPKDSDGSAKIALIAIDRSMAAWLRMREHFPEQEDKILDFLVHLERLRRATEHAFPQARAFVRPGFDEG